MTHLDIEAADVDALATVLLRTIQLLGQLGRPAAVALARLVEDGDADFDEASQWIAEIADGELRE